MKCEAFEQESKGLQTSSKAFMQPLLNLLVTGEK